MYRIPAIMSLIVGLSACSEPPYTNVSNEELETLLAGEKDESALCDGAIRIAVRLVGAKGGSVFLRDESTDEFVLAGTTGIMGASNQDRLSYSPGEGLTGWVDSGLRRPSSAQLAVV